jgi:hypothetical protein
LNGSENEDSSNGDNLQLQKFLTTAQLQLEPMYV